MSQDIKLTSVKLSCCERDCPDRNAGCHAICEKYKAFRAECDKALEKQRIKKELEHDLDSLTYKAVQRLPGKRRY